MKAKKASTGDLLRNIGGQQRHDIGSEIGQRLVELGDLLPRARGRDDAHQRAVRAVPREGIPEHEPLHQIFVSDYPPTLLEPVVDELTIIALHNQRAIDHQRHATDGDFRNGMVGERFDDPATARQAGFRRVCRLPLLSEIRNRPNRN